MIRARDISFIYGETPALDGVSLEAPAGCITGLLGPNGSGKTTLLSLLAGVLPMQRGHAELDGRPLAAMDAAEVARTAAWVPQRAEVPDGLECLELVAMGRYANLSPWQRLAGTTAAERRICLEALATCGCAEYAARPYANLSGGQQRRVLLAAALARRPRVLLLDEAAAGLDPARAVEIFDLLARLAQDGLTILSAMHDLNLAALYCRRLVLLKRGRVLAGGETAAAFCQARLMDVYDTTLDMAPHPRTGAPQAFLVPGGHAGR